MLDGGGAKPLCRDMTARQSIVLMIAALIAMIWLGVAGGVAVWTWAPVSADIIRERDMGRRGCVSLYSEPERIQSCEALHETTYVMEFNAAVFTRLLIAAGPLTGVGVWALVVRRRPRAKPRMKR